MSAQNTLVNKRARSLERAGRKDRARRRINHAGVIVRKDDVKNHRWLGFHDLPYSMALAAVFMLGDNRRMVL